jgi:hypothetical protein
MVDSMVSKASRFTAKPSGGWMSIPGLLLIGASASGSPGADCSCVAAAPILGGGIKRTSRKVGFHD